VRDGVADADAGRMQSGLEAKARLRRHIATTTGDAPPCRWVDWTAYALRCPEDFPGDVPRDEFAAAYRLVDDIIDSTEATLTEHRHAGRPGRVEHTREWIAHRRYVVVDRIPTGWVQILSGIHTSRLWPGAFQSVSRKRGPVLRVSDMRPERLRAGRVNTHERAPLPSAICSA